MLIRLTPNATVASMSPVEEMSMTQEVAKVRKYQREGKALKKRYIGSGQIQQRAFRDAVDYANACRWNNPTKGATDAQKATWARGWMDFFLAEHERLMAPMRVDLDVARGCLESMRDHGIQGARYGCYRHAEDREYTWGNFTGTPAVIVMAIEPTEANTETTGRLLHALESTCCESCHRFNDRHAYANRCETCGRAYQDRIASDPETRPVGSR